MISVITRRCSWLATSKEQRGSRESRRHFPILDEVRTILGLANKIDSTRVKNHLCGLNQIAFAEGFRSVILEERARIESGNPIKAKQ